MYFYTAVKPWELGWCNSRDRENQIPKKSKRKIFETEGQLQMTET